MLGQTKQMRNARQVTNFFSLNGKERTEYILMPATFKPGEEAKFTFQIFSETDCSFTAI